MEQSVSYHIGVNYCTYYIRSEVCPAMESVLNIVHRFLFTSLRLRGVALTPRRFDPRCQRRHKKTLWCQRLLNIWLSGKKIPAIFKYFGEFLVTFVVPYMAPPEDILKYHLYYSFHTFYETYLFSKYEGKYININLCQSFIRKLLDHAVKKR
jgi:hypothetical protein